MMRVFLFLFFYLSLSFVVQAQGYKEIVPLRSSCEDVERILKIKACSLSEVEYEEKDKKVFLYLTTQGNEKIFNKRCNVPIGTVFQIAVNYFSYNRSLKRFPLSDFVKDLSAFKRSEGDLSYFYFSEERGEEFWTTDDNLVRLIQYTATKADYKSFCGDRSK